MDDRERNEAERLNRLWDASLGFDEPIPADGLAGYTGAISALHALDDTPEPDPAFLGRLRSDVLANATPTPIRTPSSVRTVGLVWPAPIALPRRSAIRLAIAAIAAALLVAALSGGGRWLSGTGPAPMVASAMASTETATPTVAPTSTGTALRIESLSVSTGSGRAISRVTDATVIPAVQAAASLDAVIRQ